MHLNISSVTGTHRTIRSAKSLFGHTDTGGNARINQSIKSNRTSMVAYTDLQVLWQVQRNACAASSSSAVECLANTMQMCISFFII